MFAKKDNDVSGFVSELNKSLFLTYEVVTRHLISLNQIIRLIKCVLSISLKTYFYKQTKGYIIHRTTALTALTSSIKNQ